MRHKRENSLAVKQISYSDIQPNFKTRQVAVIDDSFSDKKHEANFSIEVTKGQLAGIQAEGGFSKSEESAPRNAVPVFGSRYWRRWYFASMNP